RPIRPTSLRRGRPDPGGAHRGGPRVATVSAQRAHGGVSALAAHHPGPPPAWLLASPAIQAAGRGRQRTGPGAGATGRPRKRPEPALGPAARPARHGPVAGANRNGSRTDDVAGLSPLRAGRPR